MYLYKIFIYSTTRKEQEKGIGFLVSLGAQNFAFVSKIVIFKSKTRMLAVCQLFIWIIYL